MSDTNITAEHRRAFEALTSGRFDNFCLVSCFVDGEATAAIAAVTVSSPAQDGGDGPEYLISPLFVCPTPAPERPVSPTDSLPKREPAHEPRQPHP